jgi:hypothetical protein
MSSIRPSPTSVFISLADGAFDAPPRNACGQFGNLIRAKEGGDQPMRLLRR